jgi:lysophospholipid acyltransferase (LPLAT)-like uncharacterized protein
VRHSWRFPLSASSMATGRGIRRSIAEKLATFVGPLIIRLLGSTLRIRISGRQNIEQARTITGSVIYAFWHGRLLLLTYTHRNEGINTLVSTHQDGEYIARIITELGFRTVRGSTTRGATKALLNLLEVGATKQDIGISPDGPRGPREHCQAGVIYVAKKTGLPVIPIGVSHKPSLVLSSWDRFMIPLPFAKCAVVYGQARVYDRTVSEESIQEAKLDLEQHLKAVTREADDACGRETV